MPIKSSHSGLRDWLIQRISSVIIGTYTLFIVIYLLNYHPLYFAQWKNLFSMVSMKIATLVVLISILWHAWIGLWTVLTDYVQVTAWRLFLQSAVVVALLIYVIWGVEILWG